MKKCLFSSMIILLLTPVYANYTNWYDLTPASYYGSYNSIAFGDIDSDGDLDLIYTGQGPYFKSYTNNGNGILDFYQDIDSGFGSLSSIVLGDIDSDNDLDLIMIGTTDHFRVYKNNQGFFSLYQDLITGGQEGCLNLGDIDLDGDLDLIITGYNSIAGAMFKVYKNDGRGTFLSNQNLTPGIAGSSTTLGDIDLDGDLDVIMTGLPNYFKTYTNNRSGIFSNFQDINPGGGESSIALGDIDSDGDLDLIMTGRSSPLFKVYQNNGGNFTEIQNLNPGVWYSSITLGDIDIDGDLDLIMTGDSSGVGVSPHFILYTNNGYGSFNTNRILNPSVWRGSVSFGDMDSDGDLDLIMMGGNGGSRYFKVYKNTNSKTNYKPTIPTGMNVEGINGYWRFKWNPSVDDHTSQNILQYKIAIGISQSGKYDYISEILDYPRGQANIGNIPQGWIGNPCYYQSKIPVTQRAFWKVCAIDTSFKNSDFCTEQVTGELYSKILNLEPSESIYFAKYGKVKGASYLTGSGEYKLDYSEIRIKNMENNTYWDGYSWTASSNSWLRASGNELWEYECKTVLWEILKRHYVESRPVTDQGWKGNISQGVEFIPVYQLTEYSFCNYPNPFDPNNESTCIEYLLLQDEDVKIYIYHMDGRLAIKFSFYKGNEGAREGINRIYWDGKDKNGNIVKSGVYFSYLKYGNVERLNKIVVVK
ncbi:MAG: VCBS repeat-containing protein [Spirochaetes bacterium]|nr:VCBS repeat-containing protein [Spirochaetota bacterium]